METAFQMEVVKLVLQVFGKTKYEDQPRCHRRTCWEGGFSLRDKRSSPHIGYQESDNDATTETRTNERQGTGLK